MPRPDTWQFNEWLEKDYESDMDNKTTEQLTQAMLEAVERGREAREQEAASAQNLYMPVEQPLHAHYVHILTLVQRLCHQSSYAAGWWKKDQAVLDAVPKELKKYTRALVVLAKLDLQHSELGEATEGYRKGLMDDHLPHRQMIEVELADAMIRIFDLAGWLGLDVPGAMMEKLAYNRQREDHKEENREKEGGKLI